MNKNARIKRLEALDVSGYYALIDKFPVNSTQTNRRTRHFFTPEELAAAEDKAAGYADGQQKTVLLVQVVKEIKGQGQMEAVEDDHPQ